MIQESENRIIEKKDEYNMNLVTLEQTNEASLTVESQLREQKIYFALKSILLGQLGSSNDEEVNKAFIEHVPQSFNESGSRWAEIPLVKNSRIIGKMSKEKIILQEHKYEILSTEFTYNMLLNDLLNKFIRVTVFDEEPPFLRIVRETTFKYFEEVTKCSNTLLSDFNSSWDNSILLREVYGILCHYANKEFLIYTKYCTNLTNIDEMIKTIEYKFKQVELDGEDIHVWRRQSLKSFFLLPMQRITRYPLLVQEALKSMDKNDEDYEKCNLALAALRKIADKCNKSIRTKENMEAAIALVTRIDFSENVKPIGLLSKSRWILKDDDVTQRWSSNKSIVLQQPRIKLLLFNDLFVLCKKKPENRISVFNYCKRNLVTISKTSTTAMLPEKLKKDTEGKYMFMTMLLSNHVGKQEELVFSCVTAKERDDWIEAFEPRTSEVLGEVIYEPWDCPLVLAIQSYDSNEPGHLAINIQDKLFVLRKTIDGMFEGKRVEDRKKGLFPSACTIELDSEHKQARELRQKLSRMSL